MKQGTVLRFWIGASALALSLGLAADGPKKPATLQVPLGLLPVQFPKDNPYTPENNTALRNYNSATGPTNNLVSQ